LEHWSRIN